MSQSCRKGRSRIQDWRKTPNRSHDLLKTCGAVERAKNWKTLPNAMNWRKYPEYGCIGKSRYTSFRMMDLAYKSEKFNIGRYDSQVLPDINKMAVIAARRKRSQIEGSLSEQRLHHLAQGVYPDDAEAKNLHHPLRTPTRRERWTLAEEDESALGAARGVYLLVPPCGLLLTAD